jgi:hypothetical protein
MVLRPSPYQSVHGGADHTKLEEVFHWDYVDLKQPGVPDYRPGIPWNSK